MTMNPSKLRRLAWFTLGFNLLVIAWGAYVRASGSGAGCGSHWPLCNGDVIPRAPQLETVIEYSHRVTSGIALILVCVLFLRARKSVPVGGRARRAAAWSLGFILIEAALGAGLVKLGLVADDASLFRAFAMAAHLFTTFLLVAALALTAYYSTHPRRRPDVDPPRPLLEVAALTGTMIVGVAGAIAALGDTLFPASTLAEGLSLDFSPTSHLLLRLRTFHPVLACGLGALLIYYGTQRDRSTLAASVKWLTLVQLAFGGINLILLAPIWAQMIHLLLADTLWIALVLAIAEHHLPHIDEPP